MNSPLVASESSLPNDFWPVGWPSASSWTAVLEPLFADPEFQQLQNFLHAERQQYTVYPPADQVFAAFAATAWDQVRVVILGQDPYHGPGQAEGLSFSVPAGVALPPSLKNIFKELQQDLGASQPQLGSLRGWAEQGVLLLNSVLTVREARPQSHAGQGWEWFTDQVIRRLAESKEPRLFILWGLPAQKKQQWISPPHAVLSSAHPSPLSAYRGFFGSRPFSRANQWLEANGYQPIDWTRGLGKK